MEGITAYILSVVGIVFVGVLVDIIMPDGKMNNFVKGVFGLVVLLVIITPIQKVFNPNFSLENFFYDTTATTIDTDFIEATNKQIKNELENTLVAKLEKAGFSNCLVTIDCNLSANEMKIEKVYIDISKMVINANMVHINKYNEIKEVAKNYLNVEESDVVINEWRKKTKKIVVWKFAVFKQVKTGQAYWANCYNYFYFDFAFDFVWRVWKFKKFFNLFK